jgi:hypothetical protein
MIMPSKKLLFIHIPKTGGTTIGNIIHPYDKPLVLSHENLGRKYADILKGHKFHFGEHENFNFYKQYAKRLGMDISSFFVFAFTRNPYSRLYSTWKFIRKQVDMGNTLFVRQYKYNIKESFTSWVKALSERNVYSWCQKQSWFVKRGQCNFLGRYENFEIDLRKILDIIKVQCDNIPKLNQSSCRDEYQYYYDQQCKDIVYDLFKSDFTEFHYER